MSERRKLSRPKRRPVRNWISYRNVAPGAFMSLSHKFTQIGEATLTSARSLHRVARQSQKWMSAVDTTGSKGVFSQRNVCERGGVVLGFALQEAARARKS